MDIGNWTDSPCYYVTVCETHESPNGRIGLLAGPYRTREAALAVLDACRELAIDRDPFATFYGFGTSKFADGHLGGLFNAKLRTDGLWTGEAESADDKEDFDAPEPTGRDSESGNQRCM